MDRPDSDAHRRLQDTFDAQEPPIRWTKEPREVDLTLRLFMTIYKFSYTERR